MFTSIFCKLPSPCSTCPTVNLQISLRYPFRNLPLDKRKVSWKNIMRECRVPQLFFEFLSNFSIESLIYSPHNLDPEVALPVIPSFNSVFCYVKGQIASKLLCYSDRLVLHTATYLSFLHMECPALQSYSPINYLLSP